MAVASLILGIISLIIGIFFPIIGFIGTICGVIGIVLSRIAASKLPPGQREMATAGFVVSLIGTIFSLTFFIACIACNIYTEGFKEVFESVRTTL